MKQSFLISAAAAAAFAAVVSYRVYDTRGAIVEIWKDRGDAIDVYAPDMARKGYIKKERDRWTRFDRESRREATIKKDDNGEMELDR